MDINITKPAGVVLKTAQKYCSEDISVIPVLEDITVTPTTTEQVTTPTTGKAGISKVTIEAVTSTIDSNIVAENIKKDVSILGVTGVYDPQPTLQEKTIIPTTTQQIVTADSGKDGLSKVTVEAVTSSIDSNIVAENIKKDVTILGVTGTLESGGSGSTSGTPIDVATAEEMASILSNATSDDNGKIYRYTGTTGTYINGALYWLEVPQQTEDELAGTWVFNDYIYPPTGNDVTFSFSFTSDYSSFSGIRIVSEDGSIYHIDYIYEDASLSPVSVYTGSWSSQNFKNIKILSKLSELTNGDALLTWLQANATKQ